MPNRLTPIGKALLLTLLCVAIAALTIWAVGAIVRRVASMGLIASQASLTRDDGLAIFGVCVLVLAGAIHSRLVDVERNTARIADELAEINRRKRNSEIFDVFSKETK